MSCGCGQPGCCHCLAEYPAPIVQEESLPSQIANLANQLFGVIQKSVVDGRIVWNPACGADSAIVVNGIPRNAGEGLLCYLLRALSAPSISSGMATLTGVSGGVTITIPDSTVDHYLLVCAAGNTLTVQLPPISTASNKNRTIHLLALTLGSGATITIQGSGSDNLFVNSAAASTFSFLTGGESLEITAGNPSAGVGTWFEM